MSSQPMTDFTPFLDQDMFLSQVCNFSHPSYGTLCFCTQDLQQMVWTMFSDIHMQINKFTGLKKYKLIIIPWFISSFELFWLQKKLWWLSLIKLCSGIHDAWECSFLGVVCIECSFSGVCMHWDFQIMSSNKCWRRASSYREPFKSRLL